jgi:hypothetical protein
MVQMAAYADGSAFESPAGASQVIKQPVFDGMIEHRSAVLRAKDEVDIDFGEGLWHGERVVAPLQGRAAFASNIGRCPMLALVPFQGKL